ncbi:hypothetical protein A4H97_08600 [Niastella yeongjuensis]|uniref:Uncharacterized protein n=1 Tax=Niastella yeongjuensis TaxID=354355 RepID=A0A1V9EE79_9BACT|nr:hypothetical protein [Niastella yeongjuensis]OQP44430.1 hypothetical protein A4H97_08600 [Niastella yeongjuensis]SEO87952.1 hypothetical protein SAMN05660816_03826 [Niastella yeongjuensis]
MKYLIVGLGLITASCNWAKEKTKETVNKTGEVVGKASSEFVNGVAKGVEKTFENEVKFSDQLTKQGLAAGKIVIHSSEHHSDDIISAYLIFNNNFDHEITIKVFSPQGQEYGRVHQKVKGKKGDAFYVDFEFDSRTNIDGKGTIQFE